MPIWAAYLPKLLLELGLLLVFLSYFGLPTLNNYLEGKVLTVRGGADDKDDDIYIMMKCVFVCVSRKMITFPFQAERRRREARRPLGLAGRRPALAL